MTKLAVGDCVQTLFAPKGARMVSLRAGTIGRIEEILTSDKGLRSEETYYYVTVPTPLLTSHGDLFFYDEEKNTIGSGYRKYEIRKVEEQPLSETILVYLREEGEVITIYNVSQWEGLLDASLTNYHETCPVLAHIGESMRRSAYENAYIECFTRGYTIQENGILKKDHLPGLIWAFQCLVMDIESTLKDKILRTDEEKEHLKRELAVYSEEISYHFMHCADAIKNGETLKEQLTLLTGRIESLESIVYQLKGKYRDEIISRLSLYYRVQAMIRLWNRVNKKREENNA